MGAYSKIKNTNGAVTIGTQSASTVVIGPIKIDNGRAEITLMTKSVSGGTTTPTAYKLQYAINDAEDIWADVPSGTITASATGNAVVAMATVTVVGRAVRVISGAAFAAGTAELYIFGVEK